MGKALRDSQYDMLLNTIALGQKRIQELESALIEIRDHPHCDVRTWAIEDQALAVVLGHVQGHLCCAEIARKVLESKAHN